MAEALWRISVEVEWWQDFEHNRLGVVVYDAGDNDFQAIRLDWSPSDREYQAERVEVSLPMHASASARLQELLVITP